MIILDISNKIKLDRFIVSWSCCPHIGSLYSYNLTWHKFSSAAIVVVVWLKDILLTITSKTLPKSFWLRYLWGGIFFFSARVCSRFTMQRGRYSISLMVMIPVSPAGWGTSVVPGTVGSRTWWSYSTGKLIWFRFIIPHTHHICLLCRPTYSSAMKMQISACFIYIHMYISGSLSAKSECMRCLFSLAYSPLVIYTCWLPIV